MPRRPRLWLLLALMPVGFFLLTWKLIPRDAATPAPAASAVPADPLRPAHDAVFDACLPLDRLPLSPEALKAAKAARDETWEAFRQNQKIRDLLTWIAGRESSLETLRASPDAQTCRRARELHELYLGLIYSSSMGTAVSGVPERAVFHPQAKEFIQAHLPKFPASRLAYDAGSNEIRRAGGPVDYLIVGSGPAGAVLAHELRRTGKSVAVVEQGPFFIPGAADTRAIPQLMESVGRRTSADGAILFRNAQAVGGGSTVNIDLAFSPALPIVRERIEAWRREGRIPADRFMPEEVERADAWVRSALGTREVPEAEVNANNRLLWDGALALGLHPKRYALNTYAPGASPSPVSDKKSAVDRLLLPAMLDAADPLELVPNAKALRILFDGEKGERKARGVEVEFQKPWIYPGALRHPLQSQLRPGQRVIFPARNVILCAGALGSPALLLRSGLDNPRIGEGIVAHPSLPLIGLFDRKIRPLDGTPSSVYVDDRALSDGYLMESTSADPGYVAAIAPGDPRDVFEAVSAFQYLGGFGVMLIDTPSAENRVALDAEGKPEIRYRLGEEDARRFRRGAVEGVRILFAAGARKVLLPTTEAIPGIPAGGLTDPAQAKLIGKHLAFLPNRTVLTSAHMQATLKMGIEPTTSAIGPDQRVWGTENLYVMDASVFPSSVGANPMQTVYAFAKIFADRLLDGMEEKK